MYQNDNIPDMLVIYNILLKLISPVSFCLFRVVTKKFKIIRVTCIVLDSTALEHNQDITTANTVFYLK